MGKEQKQLSFLENFVSKHYTKQPKWVRTVVYLAFAILLVFSIYRLTSGDFSVRGRILEQSSGSYHPAKNFDVRIRDKYFGTNSLGWYYLILNPSQYYKVMLGGKLTMDIIKDNTIYRNQTVALQRFDQEFEDIILSEEVEMGHLYNRHENAAFPLDVLIPPAWAGERKPELGGDRIFVTAVRMTSKVDVPREGRFICEVGGQPVEMLSVQSGGWLAGSIPLVQGERVGLEQEYFFNIPVRFTREPSAFIIIHHSGGLFSGYEEAFPVELNHEFAEPFEAVGNKGSVVELMRVSAYNVVLWQKQDIAEVEGALIEQLHHHGFRVDQRMSKLGYHAQTNALFGGLSVPYTTMQTVLRLLYAHELQMKTVEYQKSLKSGDDFAIQIGGSKAYDERPAIPPEIMEHLIDAGSEGEFKEILTSLE